MKGKPDEVEKIKEAKGLPGIIELLRAINVAETPFFSVGCEKCIEPYENGAFYARGYVEFAFNFAPLLRDVQYMALFKTFNDYILSKPLQEGWSVNWELQPAVFKAANVAGYSCCMWLHVRSYLTRDIAVRNYNDLARHLVGFFDGISPPAKGGLEPLY